MRSKDLIEKELFNVCKQNDSLLQEIVNHYINILNDDQIDNIESILSEQYYSSYKSNDL
tara:strand:+ start:322 stop:498 length:177 start_codon:yes stop_codon:yes gene_type:complete